MPFKVCLNNSFAEKFTNIDWKDQVFVFLIFSYLTQEKKLTIRSNTVLMLKSATGCVL